MDNLVRDAEGSHVSLSKEAPHPLSAAKGRGSFAHKKKRDRHTRRKVAFFRYGYYNIVFKFFVEHILDADYVELPDATRKTLELGTLHSNDFVCAPFKHILGDYIEALDAGADVLFQFAGPCRLGYYGELQESILKDMGYDFDMVNFADLSGSPIKDYITTCKKIVNPNLSVPNGVKNMLAAFKMAEYLDAYNDAYLSRAGFEINTGAFARNRKQFLSEMNQASCKAEIEDIYKRGMKTLLAEPINKPHNPVRIGIVGEYFTAVDPMSNLDLEQKFLNMGVELARKMNITHRNIHYNEATLRNSIAEYVTYEMGPTSTLTISAAKEFALRGFDGIVHVKCSGCTPEIDCMPVLQRLSRDYKIPILYLSYDSQTSDAGLDTRLEAFYDMIAMRKAHE